jgi:hypothetical protein
MRGEQEKEELTREGDALQVKIVQVEKEIRNMEKMLGVMVCSSFFHPRIIASLCLSCADPCARVVQNSSNEALRKSSHLVDPASMEMEEKSDLEQVRQLSPYLQFLCLSFSFSSEHVLTLDRNWSRPVSCTVDARCSEIAVVRTWTSCWPTRRTSRLNNKRSASLCVLSDGSGGF